MSDGRPGTTPDGRSLIQAARPADSPFEKCPSCGSLDYLCDDPDRCRLFGVCHEEAEHALRELDKIEAEERIERYVANCEGYT